MFVQQLLHANNKESTKALHQLLTFYEGNSPMSGGFPYKGSVIPVEHYSDVTMGVTASQITNNSV